MGWLGETERRAITLQAGNTVWTKAQWLVVMFYGPAENRDFCSNLPSDAFGGLEQDHKTNYMFPTLQNYLLCPNVNFLKSLNMLSSPFHYFSLTIIQHWHPLCPSLQLNSPGKLYTEQWVLYWNNSDLYLHHLRNIIVTFLFTIILLSFSYISLRSLCFKHDGKLFTNCKI